MVELSDIAPSFAFVQHEGFVQVSGHYKPEEFGNAVLVMAGQNFSLKFERDRGQIFVDIGNSDIGWEKLEYALIFLDNSIKEEQLGSPPTESRLADLARSNWKKIFQLHEDTVSMSAFKDFCQIQSSNHISRIFSKS
jgi:hypothetical protein